MEDKRKHLELIQTVINRMASNLFFLRGWAITLITGLFAISAGKGVDGRYLVIAFIPLVVFWILDGYFLSHERRFRNLYDDIRKLEDKDVDFSMDTEKYKGIRRNTWLGSMFSTTLLWFYTPLAVAMVIILWLINK